MIYGVDIGGVHIKITSLDQTHDLPKVKSAFFPFKDLTKQTLKEV